MRRKWTLNIEEREENCKKERSTGSEEEYGGSGGEGADDEGGGGCLEDEELWLASLLIRLLFIPGSRLTPRPISTAETPHSLPPTASCLVPSTARHATSKATPPRSRRRFLHVDVVDFSPPGQATSSHRQCLSAAAATDLSSQPKSSPVVSRLSSRHQFPSLRSVSCPDPSPQRQSPPPRVQSPRQLKRR